MSTLAPETCRPETGDRDRHAAAAVPDKAAIRKVCNIEKGPGANCFLRDLPWTERLA
jgi:hypothetical protein